MRDAKLYPANKFVVLKIVEMDARPMTDIPKDSRPMNVQWTIKKYETRTGSKEWAILRDGQWIAEACSEAYAELIRYALCINEQWSEPVIETTRPEQRVIDVRPHSRACGFRPHPHGTACSSDCPTCKGHSQEWFDKHNLQMGPGDFDRPRDVPVTKSYVDGQLPGVGYA